jgi:hypothetical protein
MMGGSNAFCEGHELTFSVQGKRGRAEVSNTEYMRKTVLVTLQFPKPPYTKTP